MAAKQPKGRELKPWDQRPWPKEGDASQDALYAAIGRVLSEWERFEAGLSFIFAALVGEHGNMSAAARRSYCAIRTFEGRADMLRAASESHFSQNSNETLLRAFKDVLKSATAYSPRRHEIAHGAVDYYRPEPPEPPFVFSPELYALLPSYAMFKEWTLKGEPAYCYTTNELEYFRTAFAALRVLASSLAGELMASGRSRALHGKRLTLYRRLASQGSPQSDLPGSEHPPEPSQE